MKRAILVFGTVMMVFGSVNCRAGDFEFAVDSPKFKVSLPGVPSMKMEAHPMRATQPHLRFLGSEGPYTVSIITPTAAAGMTPLECASATLRTLGARPGVPQASEIYKAKINVNTFVVIYVAPIDGVVRLNAHVLSAVGGTHCIEVHASKMSEEHEDLKPWIDSLEKSNIQLNE